MMLFPGIRNTVGFDWDADGKLYFTNNGIDQLGNDSPDDTLNVAPSPGLFFGFPYCHAYARSSSMYLMTCSPDVPPKRRFALFDSAAIHRVQLYLKPGHGAVGFGASLENKGCFAGQRWKRSCHVPAGRVSAVRFCAVRAW